MDAIRVLKPPPRVQSLGEGSIRWILESDGKLSLGVLSCPHATPQKLSTWRTHIFAISTHSNCNESNTWIQPDHVLLEGRLRSHCQKNIPIIKTYTQYFPKFVKLVLGPQRSRARVNYTAKLSVDSSRHLGNTRFRCCIYLHIAYGCHQSF